jgi:hypothetical protein
MAKKNVDEEQSKGFLLFLGQLLIFVVSGFLITGIAGNPTVTNFWPLLGKFAFSEALVLSIIWIWTLKSGTGFMNLFLSLLGAIIKATLYVALCNSLWVILCAFSA